MKHHIVITEEVEYRMIVEANDPDTARRQALDKFVDMDSEQRDAVFSACHARDAYITHSAEEIHTYTPDMTRPLCPYCGSPVEMPVNVLDPTQTWFGKCAQGHGYTYQLDDDEEQDETIT